MPTWWGWMFLIGDDRHGTWWRCCCTSGCRCGCGGRLSSKHVRWFCRFDGGWWECDGGRCHGSIIMKRWRFGNVAGLSVKSYSLALTTMPLTTAPRGTASGLVTHILQNILWHCKIEYKTFVKCKWIMLPMQPIAQPSNHSWQKICKGGSTADWLMSS